jgi:cysteine desulfurase
VGSVQPISEIAKIIEEFHVNNFSGGGIRYPLFHTDAVQSFQYLDCKVDELGVDFLTLSAHKIGGPKGIGALYVRDAKTIRPIITGGGQEFGFRSGTENVPSVVGFGKAVELAMKEREARAQYTQKIRTLVLSELKKIYPRVKIHGDKKYTLPHIVNVQFPGVLAEMLLVALDTEGVAISTGSACSARGTSISHVLRAMGIQESAIRESVRLSFCYSLSLQDVKKALSVFKKTLKNLGK